MNFATNIAKPHFLGCLALWLAGAGLLFNGQVQAQAEAEGYEILTRGPVHEAFAATVVYDPQPGIIVDVEPPELIEEQPPEHRPVGANVTWIPGYWAWDEEPRNFIWISGVWRNVPPGRQWVPGYWSPVSNSRYQWTSGYWAGSDVQEVTYLPAPPATLEVGANIAAPTSNHSWIPGSWSWRQSRYAWRPGYWTEVRPDWTWCPSYYSWTPRGYVHVDGYWDYPVVRRGVMFAPVHFHRPVYAHAGFYYRPSVVISINIFSSHLFLRPSYCHYYFGDYYHSRYHTAGYYAPHTYHYDRRGYDPIFAHQRWQHRGDRDWDHRWAQQYDYRRDHQEARPPRTWSEMSDWQRREDRSGGESYVTPLEEYVSSRQASTSFEPVTRESRERIMEQRREISRFRKERRDSEQVAAPERAGERREVSTRRLSRSPVAAPASVAGSPGESERAVTGRPVPELAERARSSQDSGAPATRGAVRSGRVGDEPASGERMRGRPGSAPLAAERTSPSEAASEEPSRQTRSGSGRPAVTDRARPVDPPGQRTEVRRGVPAPDTDHRAGNVRANPRPTPQIDRRAVPQPTPKVERREAPQARPQPAPRIQRREVPQARPQPAPQIQRREVPQARPQPAPQIQRREVPQARPQPAPRIQRREVPQARPQPAPQIQRREIPQARPQPAPRIQRREVPQARPQPAPRIQRREVPQARPQPAPRIQRREIPQARPQPAPQIQRREVPQARPQPAPQIQRREVPQARPQPQRREVPQIRAQAAPPVARQAARPQPMPQVQRRESPRSRPQAATAAQPQAAPLPQAEERGKRKQR